MTTAIGVVMTEHIVAGRLEDQQLAGKRLRFPTDRAELDALSAIPGGELVEILADRSPRWPHRERARRRHRRCRARRGAPRRG